MDSLTRDDLRAAVAAGVLTEAQAAQLLIVGEARQGRRAAMTGDDEPFELFRGFAEIFVSIGIVLLISGIMMFGTVMGGIAMALLAAALCWVFALYFTRRRRMVLPSVVLTTGFAIGFAAVLGDALGLSADTALQQRGSLALFCLAGIAGMALWYRVFRVPFAMFPLGLLAAVLVFLLVDIVRPFNDLRGWEHLFDLRSGSGLAIATLLFGLIALAGGLAFDMRDPHRLGRMSASGFWLHILAAPALVNTVALSAYNTGGTAGYVLLALALAAAAGFALVIDRRSFLTAGIAWLGVLIGWAIRADESPGNFAALLVILGGFLTFMGSFWAAMRARIMRALPDFPGKRRLPPYAPAAE